MLSFASKRIMAFLFTALVVAPMFFLMPVTITQKGVGINIVEAAWWSCLYNTVDCVQFLTGGGDNCGVLQWRCATRDLMELILVRVPAFFFGLAGIVFDVFIAFSLSSTIIQNQDFVNKGWVIMRDLSNTFFIFILLYIAIATILQTAGGQTKRLLATLVVVALFMNFSLYITKFVIDVGNVFALEFYVNMGVLNQSYIDLGPNDIKPRSISFAFNDAFKIQKLFGPDFLTQAAGNLPLTAFIFTLVGIMYMVAAFVFLTAGWLFLARVVAFWFLMILAPLAFFSYILPFTRGKIWSRWSSELVSQTFFAPIFLFFIYLTLMLAGTVDTLFKQSTNPLTGDMSFLQTVFVSFLTFFALITTLLFGLKTAKSMSGTMGESMLKIGGAVTGAAVGAGAWAGRNSVGLGMRKFLAQKDADGRTLEDRMRASRTGNLLLKSTGDLGAKSSFDLRNAGVGGYTVAGGAKSIGGMDIGQGTKGGQAAQFAEKVKAKEAEINKIQDPKLRAKALHSLATGALPSDKDAAFEIYSKMSAKERTEMATKSPEYADMFQGFAQRMGGKERGENHKEALANAKDVRDPATGAITKSKDAVRAEYLHSMEDFGTKGLTGAKLAEQQAKNRIAQREALENMSPDDVSDMLTAAKNNTTSFGPHQVKAIEETIARTGHEKQVSINQAILRDVVEKKHPITGATIKSSTQRADIINAVSNPDVQKALWAKESADMRAEMLAAAAPGTPQAITLQSLEDSLSDEQREQTRSAKIKVKQRTETAKRKTDIEDAIAQISTSASAPAVIAAQRANIDLAVKGLSSQQFAALDQSILTSPEMERHLNRNRINAIATRGELDATAIHDLILKHLDQKIPVGHAPLTGDTLEEMKKLYKDDKIKGYLDQTERDRIKAAI